MKRLILAFLYSIHGLRAAWADERAFREEVILSAILVPAALYLAPDKISLVLMIGSLLLVMALELMTTAIEAAIDRIGSEIHPLAKKAKDAASASVLIALVNAGFVWCVILFG